MNILKLIGFGKCWIKYYGHIVNFKGNFSYPSYSYKRRGKHGKVHKLIVLGKKII
jgi:hypothetical protein